MSEKNAGSSTDSAADSLGRVEILISTLLRTGILVSLSLVLVGVILMYVRHPDEMQSPGSLAHLKSEAYVFPTTIVGVFRGVAAGQGRAVILLGVFVLFLTPLLRVVASIIAIATQKDWSFALMTSMVLAFLLLSLVLGKSG